LVTGIVAVTWGVGDQTFILVGAMIAITFVPLPSWFWAAAALGSAMLMRGLTDSGVLPAILNFADFGFVYVGLAAVMTRHLHRWSPEARRLGIALLALLSATCISWALNPSDIARPFLTFALWAEPFAFILLLLVEPPSPRHERLLLGWFGILVALQIPFALYQAQTFGLSDPVVGTLTGSGAGAHLVAGVAALAGLALIAWGYAGSVRRGLVTTVLAGPLIIGIPLLGDAKQVIFALPLAGLVLIGTTRGGMRRFAVAAPAILALYILLAFVPAGRTAFTFIEDASEGRAGKLVGLEVLADELDTSLSGWAFGLGPANGLSRAAYLTRPDEGSPLLLLELEPARLPPIADAAAARVAGGTSFNIPLSSAVGVLSDIGVIGLITYGGVLLAVVSPLWQRRRGWLAQAALAGWVMSVPLAVTFDWWEQPPFMLSLALLTAVAIIDADREVASDPRSAEFADHA
jgi:hypothetical protein